MVAGREVATLTAQLNLAGVLLLVFLSGISIGQTQDVFEYFNNPRINFGDFFHASFPNGSIAQLYECLCDMNITHCSLTYELFDGLNNQFGFPYYYTITELVQNRTETGQPGDTVYTRSVLCDTLNHSPIDNLNCRRLPVGDRTCVTNQLGCLEYSVQQDDDHCEFDCGMLLWLADFSLHIEYINFGSRSIPVKNGVCPGDIVSTTPYLNTTIVIGTNTTYPQVNNSSDGGGSNLTQGDISRQEIESVETSNSNFVTSLVFVWVAAACLVVVAAAVIVAFIMIRKRGHARQSTSSGCESSDSGSHPDSTPPETSETSTDETDTVRYHTLDEMAVGAEPETDFAECDDQGYNVIRDKDLHVSPNGVSSSRDEKQSCRPLPHLPGFAEDKVNSRDSSEATTSSVATNSPPPTSPTTADDFVSSNLSSSAAVGPIGSLIPVLPIGPQQEPSTGELSNKVPPPRPHKRLVDLDDHTYLGLVNLKPDQALFGHVTEVKLVRTPQGQLELVDVKGELPAFTEYYTRILLFNQDEDVLGVVGLSEETSNMENDHSPREPLSQREISLTSSNGSVTNNLGAVRACLDDMDKPFPDVIYFGSLEIDPDMNFEPCDYLTVLDNERGSLQQLKTEDYLTVLDVESDR